MSENDDERAAGLLQGGDADPHETRPNALTLKPWEHWHGRQAHASDLLRVLPDGGRREEDVTDNLLVDRRDQGNVVGASLAQRIDDVGLARLAESILIDRADSSRVVELFQAVVISAFL